MRVYGAKYTTILTVCQEISKKVLTNRTHRCIIPPVKAKASFLLAGKASVFLRKGVRERIRPPELGDDEMSVMTAGAMGSGRAGKISGEVL